jgi:adenylate cyclase
MAAVDKRMMDRMDAERDEMIQQIMNEWGGVFKRLAELDERKAEIIERIMTEDAGLLDRLADS